MAKQYAIKVQVPTELGLSAVDLAALKQAFRVEVANVMSSKLAEDDSPVLDTNVARAPRASSKKGSKGSSKKSVKSSKKR
ncbi:MAG TPA: hypothetical protein VGC66_01250 [Pyrinomonadaceae bacterium]|jgi:hypothetical protein